MALPAWRPWSSSREVRLLRPLLGGAAGAGSPRRSWRAACHGSTIRRMSTALRAGAPARGRLAPPARRRSRQAATSRAARDGAWRAAAVDILEFDPTGAVAIDRAGFARLGATCRRGCSAGSSRRSAGGTIRRGASGWSGRRPAFAARRCAVAKSGKSQDFTLSACRLELRQAPGSRRLRWIVRPENGRKTLEAASPSFRLNFSLAARAARPILD